MVEQDGRRKVGAETRRRLMEATADALAAEGVRGVSLRAVSAAAGANVAAVKYHFGSRDALIAEVLADATGQVSGVQSQRLGELEARDDAVSVREWVAAWAQPILTVITPTTPRQRRLGQIISRALDPETLLADEVRALAALNDARLVRGLAGVLGLSDEQLWLRLAVMASAMAGLASGTFTPLLERAATDRRLDDRLLDLLEAVAVSGGG